jgi:hypothetical protein
VLSFLFVYYLGIEWLVDKSDINKGLPNCLSKLLYHFSFPTTVFESFLCIFVFIYIFIISITFHFFMKIQLLLVIFFLLPVEQYYNIPCRCKSDAVKFFYFCTYEKYFGFAFKRFFVTYIYLHGQGFFIPFPSVL